MQRRGPAARPLIGKQYGGPGHGLCGGHRRQRSTLHQLDIPLGTLGNQLQQFALQAEPVTHGAAPGGQGIHPGHRSSKVQRIRASARGALTPGGG